MSRSPNESDRALECIQIVGSICHNFSIRSGERLGFSLLGFKVLISNITSSSSSILGFETNKEISSAMASRDPPQKRETVPDRVVYQG